MPDEIEIKLKIDDLAQVRDRLRAADAVCKGERFEVNAFFDTPDRSLKNKGSGLRLRSMTAADGSVTSVVTLKGKASGDDVRRREEIEFAVGEFDAAQTLLERLGYVPTIAFEKRRETWELGGCLVELDVVPRLGTFVEIEGDDEAAIAAVRETLGLTHQPAVTKGYASMIAALIQAEPSIGSRLAF